MYLHSKEEFQAKDLGEGEKGTLYKPETYTVIFTETYTVTDTSKPFYRKQKPKEGLYVSPRA